MYMYTCTCMYTCAGSDYDENTYDDESNPTKSSSPVLMENLRCGGDETALADCGCRRYNRGRRYGRYRRYRN